MCGSDYMKTVYVIVYATFNWYYQSLSKLPRNRSYQCQLQNYRFF